MTKKLILLVDDDPEFVQFAKALLSERGMQVVTASSKAEGQAAFETYSPACVILDIFLPDGSGVDLIRPMRAANSSLPIIIVSGQGSVDEVVRAMKDGASDYIRKPFHGEELFLKVQMVLENTQAKWELEELRTKVSPEEEYNLLFGMSDRMSKVQAILDQVAGTDITVLISGESGTGKELVAKAIHKSSDRSSEPFVKVNCAALPRELLESELFGFEKGAFTGAHRRKYGRFEMAQNGTIFLDEISEMHMDLQSKLLHVLQEKQFFRIGGEREVKAGCRILCATNKNMERMVEEGRFRRDLYYRINVVNILVPPLRDRKEDIPVLVDYFIGRYSQMYNRGAARTSPKLMEMFLNYSWPGNVRELENNVKRFIILGNESQLISEFQRRRETGQYSAVPDDGPVDTMAPVPPARNVAAGMQPAQEMVPRNGGDFDLNLSINRSTLKEVAKIAQRNAERELIQRVLQQTRWNRRKAAQILDISYKALLYKIKECGLNME
ncbi:MAG: sigma-54-dependent Fis family transcriptional regulator [Deltaproteobacteria bacterium]|nr:sigma-54-dependent Fis family transcriptional regulator [Deltaproteobacteria bacterium]